MPVQVWGCNPINVYCRWYALLLARSVNTQLELCGAWSGALNVTGRRLIAMAGRLVVEVGWRHCRLKNCWECLLFTGARSIGACCSVKPDEARELIWLVPIKSSPTCSCNWLHCNLQNVSREHANCTVEMYVLTGPRHLGNWLNWTASSHYITQDSTILCFLWAQFLATDPEILGSISGTTRFSEK
jgi:hypothetical protein